MNDRRPELTEGQSQPRSTGIGKWILSITLVVALLAGGTVVASLLSRFKEEPARRESIAVIPVVRTQTLQPENVTELYLGYGSVDPIQQAVVAAEVPGRVVELPAELREGKEIRKGDVLLKIDDREFRQAKARADAFLRADQAALDELKIEAEKLGDLMATAQHEIELTEAEWNRISALYEKNLAAKKEFDFANLAWKQATRVLQGYEMQASRIQPRSQQLLASMAAKEADAQTAELNMERCTVKAPFDGVIMQRFVDPGNRVGPGMQLFSIVNNNVVEVPAQLPGSVYGKIKVGAECVLQSESMTDVQWTGTVSRIAPTVDQQTRTFAAYIVIDNQEQIRPCVPGTFTKVTVKGPEHSNAMLVPRGAISDGTIFVFGEGEARQRKISIDFMLNEQAGISGDVKAGERVILPPISALKDRMAVRTLETSRRDEPSQLTPGSPDARPAQIDDVNESQTQLAQQP